MKGYNVILVAVVCAFALALLALSMLMWIGITTNEWDVGLIGIYVTVLALALGVLAAAESIRTGTEQYETLAKKLKRNSDKLDTIANRQEELIALVKSTIQTSRDEDSSPAPPIDADDST